VGGGTAVFLRKSNKQKAMMAGPVTVAADTSTPTLEPENTPEPKATPDTQATVDAAIRLTRENEATKTAPPSPSPTKKATATVTPTINATAAFLESCTPDVALKNVYTYQNEQFDAAPVGATFPVNWVLENSSSCPWSGSLVWAYKEGETFGYEDDPVDVPALAPGEQITISVDFVAPSRAGQYESAWQLMDDDTGDVIGEPLAFSLGVYVPATPTSAATATATAVPTTEATATVEQPIDLIYVVNNCEYIGEEYRCQVQITPYGGGGGPYTVFVFDADQPAEYRGAFPVYHFAKARRCATYNHEVIAIDDATGTRISKQIYIDPNDYISGGCTLP
jgi:hypothetical protein